MSAEWPKNPLPDFLRGLRQAGRVIALGLIIESGGKNHA